MIYPTMEARIIANSFHDLETGCWIWLGKSILSRGGGRNSKPYPVLTMRKKGRKSPVNVRVHRLVLELFKGLRLDKRHVGEHKCPCRNTLCIAPDHLDRGTPKTNAQEREEHRCAA